MTIEYYYEVDFELIEEKKYTEWIISILNLHKYSLGALNYIFCSDDYLLPMNQRYLGHNTLTDIITFDYSNGTVLSADIFISIDRVKDNSTKYIVGFDKELRRVMIHGVLHLMEYDDKTFEDREVMRNKEDELIKMFHVEQ
jgi:rRNA maturation RNase YbeY